MGLFWSHENALGCLQDFAERHLAYGYRENMSGKIISEKFRQSIITVMGGSKPENATAWFAERCCITGICHGTIKQLNP